jgi:hypothetical protein
MTSARLTKLRKLLAQQIKKWPATMTPVPVELWPVASDVPESRKPVSVWRSRDFLAQVFAFESGPMRLSVNRAALDDRGGWVADILWDELQRIKRECGFGDWDAVEIYPRDRDIVNVANMRHLWVMPEPLPFAWRKEP